LSRLHRVDYLALLDTASSRQPTRLYCMWSGEPAVDTTEHLLAAHTAPHGAGDGHDGGER
jgi:hypothetical protein